MQARTPRQESRPQQFQSCERFENHSFSVGYKGCRWLVTNPHGKCTQEELVKEVRYTMKSLGVPFTQNLPPRMSRFLSRVHKNPNFPGEFQVSSSRSIPPHSSLLIDVHRGTVLGEARLSWLSEKMTL